MNKTVSYEIAKLLKEKGFDDESAWFYNKDVVKSLHIHLVINSKIKII